MKNFATALKSEPFESGDSEIQELIIKFNTNHDDLGRFTTSEHSASSSGKYDTTRSTAYGVKGSKHRAMTEPRISGSGKRESAIHRESNESASSRDAKHNGVVVREVHDALYQHRDDEGNKKAQAVKVSRKVLVGRDKSNRDDYINPAKNSVVPAETAQHLLTGLKTNKSTTIFQSHALDKNSSHGDRMITMNISNKAFKNIKELHDSLESHGLGDAIVHKTEDGFRVTHTMKNSKSVDGTPSGKAKQRRCMEFRRSMKKEHVDTDHHAGTKKTYSVKNQKKELDKFAAANPTHEISLAYKAHTATATA